MEALPPLDDVKRDGAAHMGLGSLDEQKEDVSEQQKPGEDAVKNDTLEKRMRRRTTFLRWRRRKTE